MNIMQDFNYQITKEIKENTIVMSPETFRKFKQELLNLLAKNDDRETNRINNLTSTKM